MDKVILDGYNLTLEDVINVARYKAEVEIFEEAI